MRMTPAQARAIARRAKTQLRIPVDTRLVAPLRPAGRHSGRPATYTVDDILPIDSDQRTYCKIIAAIRAPLGTLTHQEAEAEGYPTVDEFEIDWVERHDSEWLNRQISYLTEEGIPEEEAEETRAGWAKSRYLTRWTARDTWHLTIEPFDDLPLLLPGLTEEPEAIPIDRLNRRWGIKSARKHKAAHVEALEEKLARCLTVEERIAVVRAEAHRQGRDIRTHLRAIDRRLEDITKLLQIEKAA